jgi:hypothetical protein
MACQSIVGRPIIDAMPRRFQFSLRAIFWLTTAVAVGCVVVPSCPSLLSQFMADSRHWLVTVALAIFALTAASRRISQ